VEGAAVLYTRDILEDEANRLGALCDWYGVFETGVKIGLPVLLRETLSLLKICIGPGKGSGLCDVWPRARE